MNPLIKSALRSALGNRSAPNLRIEQRGRSNIDHASLRLATSLGPQQMEHLTEEDDDGTTIVWFVFGISAFKTSGSMDSFKAQ